MPRLRHPGLHLAVLASGIAGLAWEVLWQHHAALALGVSAFGTAVTLASLMAGLGLGGLLAGRLARGGHLRRPLAAYGVAEIVIGLGALSVPPGLALLSALDVHLYAISPTLAAVAHVSGIALVLLIPATAMGATIPILAPYAAERGISIAGVYALNILGAVLGILGATFVLLPAIGVTRTGLAAAGINLAVGWWGISRRGTAAVELTAEAPRPWPPRDALMLAAASGFVVFMLEVSWFRSIRAALQATTESFALLLAAFLLSLAAGGWIVAWLGERAEHLVPRLLPLAGLAMLCATPAIDSFDLLAETWAASTFTLAAAAQRLGWLVLICGVPVTLLGMIFPHLLAVHGSTSSAGRLYAVNTASAVAGALMAGFVLLPMIGATYTSWLAAGVVLVASLVAWRDRRGAAAALACALTGLAVASFFGGPEARERVQGIKLSELDEVLYVEEGPDSTVWIGQRQDGVRSLVIDGFVASSEDHRASYMRWMGHLPALASQEDIGEALVICFGTGQTADAVRQHAPERLHVVDVNRAVLEGAPYFPANHGVLEDSGVRSVVMDGRAFLRRRQDLHFDLVTLEPMPPNFAGSNHLYSRDFYALIGERLAPGGMVAQWVPFHLLTPDHMLSVIATFFDVFPETHLWVDPVGKTGILVGGFEPWELREVELRLELGHEEIQQQMRLGPKELAVLADGTPRITDDNQLLSYGADRLRFNPAASGEIGMMNLVLLDRLRSQLEEVTGEVSDGKEARE